VRLELELAVLELKQKFAALGVGIGLTAGAAVFAVFALGFMFATIAAGLATFLATWLALLIVTLFLFVLVAVLGLLGRRSIRKGSPPVPQQAIHEAKLTTTAIRSE
jgi:membrane protein implicated in regulation of membrane protease activity